MNPVDDKSDDFARSDGWDGSYRDAYNDGFHDGRVAAQHGLSSLSNSEKNAILKLASLVGIHAEAMGHCESATWQRHFEDRNEAMGRIVRILNGEES